MRVLGLATCVLGVSIGQAGGGVLYLGSDVGGSVDLAPGESASINIMLVVGESDGGFAYAGVLLNDNDDQAAGPLSVTDLIAGLEGPHVIYDRTWFELPADISHDQENEYGLAMGRVDGYTWGPGSYTLDTLVITHTGDETSGTLELTLEISERSPWIDFPACKWWSPPPQCYWLDLGVGSPDNPFIVNLVPPPPCDGDANGDGAVDPLDSGFVLARLDCEVDAGDPDCDAADQNNDGQVDPLDVGYVTARLGTCESSAPEVDRSNCPWLSGPQFTTDDKGLGTKQLAFGDFDGDGFPDLAVANSNSAGVAVLRSEGNGYFAEAVTYATAPPWGLAVGDLNGDGHLDIAAASDNESVVSTLLNHGNGTFADAQQYSTPSASHGIATADLDNDGDLDLVIANTHVNALSVMLNEGNGTFGEYIVYGDSAYYEFVALGDLNGDEYADIAVTTGSNDNVIVFLNNGDGSFGTAQVHSVGGSPASLALSDLDADGDLDLAVVLVADAAGLIVLLNNGDATFDQTGTYQLGTGSQGIAAGDYDNDGDIDLAMGNATTWDVRVMLNAGDGTFYPSGHAYAVGAHPQYVAMADVDGDGDLDLATSNDQAVFGDVTVLLNSGEGVFLGAKRYYPPGEPEALAIGDLDGDGDSDLVFGMDDGEGTGGIHVWLNDGFGELVFASHYHSVSTNPNNVALGDVDGDGDLDLAVPNWDAAVLFNDGNGSFGALQQYYTEGSTNWVLLEDLNGDGHLDLVGCSDGAQDDVDTVSIWFNTGDGSFGSPQVYYSFNYPYSVTSGDFDNDGDRDLAVVNLDTDDISVLTNSGDGTFADSARYAVGHAPLTIASGDLNGDGNFDLVTAGDGIGGVWILLSNGASGFAPAVHYDSWEYGHTRSLVITDVDLDGDQDIVAAAVNSVWVLVNSGDGTFSHVEQYAVGYDAHYLATGELNGDDYPDLAASSRGSDDVTVLLSTGGCVCAGDANNDGLVDPLDSGFVLSRFGCEGDAGDPDCDAADQNDDGEVNPLDVGYVTARFGECE